MSVLALAILAGCGSGKKDEAADPPLASQCVHRMLEQDGGPNRDAGGYLRRTYCEPFAKRGWVHADGTISIRAHEWLLGGGACETVHGTTTTPCDPRAENEAPVLECALLHLVRRREVRLYVEKLQQMRGKVQCDDGTPLAELGVA